MRNISVEIKKAGYSGEFYFMATGTLYTEIGQLLLRYEFRKDFFNQNYDQPILTGDIQVIEK